MSLLLAAAVTAACSHGSGGSEPPPASLQARVVVANGSQVLAPSTAPLPDLSGSRIDPARVEAFYRFTTPVDTPFGLDLVSWPLGHDGASSVRIEHLRDGPLSVRWTSSLISAGLFVSSTSSIGHGNDYLAAYGTDTVRVSLQGRIVADQLLAVSSLPDKVILVEIAIGPPSVIGRADEPMAGPPAGALASTLYSSNSWRFGAPTLTRDAERTTIVCREGLHGWPAYYPASFELRLQQPVPPGALVCGASQADHDQHVDARQNVVAIASGAASGLRARLSFDGGATFAQDAVVAPSAASARFVQCAVGANFDIAMTGWRRSVGGEPEFVVVEGRPQAVDALGNPTWFVFDLPRVLATAPADAVLHAPALAWSTGADLAIGYGFTSFKPGPGWLAMSSLATSVVHCATKRPGGAFVDALVDRQPVLGRGSSVALRGQGAGLEVLCAYEASDGLRVATSHDGGVTFATAAAFGRAGDQLPKVVVRETAAGARLDVLWLALRAHGLELHRAHWSAWPGAMREDSRLVSSDLQTVPEWWRMIPGLEYTVGPFGGPAVVGTQLAPFGYDVVSDGNDLLVAYDLVTIDNFAVTLGSRYEPPPGVLYPPYAPWGPSMPPPLAPGITEPVRPVAVDDTHQLRLLRLP